MGGGVAHVRRDSAPTDGSQEPISRPEGRCDRPPPRVSVASIHRVPPLLLPASSTPPLPQGPRPWCSAGLRPVETGPEPATVVAHVPRCLVAGTVLGKALLRRMDALADVHAGIRGVQPLADGIMETQAAHQRREGLPLAVRRDPAGPAHAQAAPAPGDLRRTGPTHRPSLPPGRDGPGRDGFLPRPPPEAGRAL